MQAPTIAALVLGGVLLLEGGAALSRHTTRSTMFAAAAERAKKLGRPLLVVGDPDAGMHTRLIRAYGCGDVCVDLNGCPSCPVAISADITKPLPYADDSVVVFCSCVLEYVPDMPAAYKELLRVAGDRDNLFIVTVQPWTLTATLYPGAEWAGWSSGGSVAMMEVGTVRKLVTASVLVGLAAYATSPLWWPAKPSTLPATPGPASPALPEEPRAHVASG